MQAEMDVARLREERLKAADEKKALQTQLDEALAGKAQLEAAHLASEAERLRVAEALVELRLEGGTQAEERERDVVSLQERIDAMRAEVKKSGAKAATSDRAAKARAKDLERAIADKKGDGWCCCRHGGGGGGRPRRHTSRGLALLMTCINFNYRPGG